MSNTRPRDGSRAPNWDTPACGPINVAAAQESSGVPERVQTSIGTDAGPSSIFAPAPVAAPDILDTEQDAYARKRGYRNIDNLLDNPRRR